MENKRENKKLKDQILNTVAMGMKEKIKSMSTITPLIIKLDNKIFNLLWGKELNIKEKITNDVYGSEIGKIIEENNLQLDYIDIIKSGDEITILLTETTKMLYCNFIYKNHEGDK